MRKEGQKERRPEKLELQCIHYLVVITSVMCSWLAVVIIGRVRTHTPSSSRTLDRRFCAFRSTSGSLNMVALADDRRASRSSRVTGQVVGCCGRCKGRR